MTLEAVMCMKTMETWTLCLEKSRTFMSIRPAFCRNPRILMDNLPQAVRWQRVPRADLRRAMEQRIRASSHLDPCTQFPRRGSPFCEGLGVQLSQEELERHPRSRLHKGDSAFGSRGDQGRVFGE